MNESIDFLKSSLEKTKDGFVRIRDIETNGDGAPSTPGQAAKNGVHLATSATNIKDKAAIHMLLACKRNVILFDFFRTGMLSLAAHKQRSPEKHLGKLNTCVHISFLFSVWFYCVACVNVVRNIV